MYFDSEKFVSYLKHYCDMLRDAVHTSWLVEFAISLGGIETLSEESPDPLKINYQSWTEWYSWHAYSFGELLIKWFIVLPTVAILTILNFVNALLKILLWFIFLGVAVFLYLLFAIRFGDPP